jgi:hypothetical protein
MIQDIASIATAVGVYFAVIGLRQARIQRMRQFESMFVQRYWKLMDDLSLQAWQGMPPRRSRVSPGDEKAVRAYYQLCEDEMELRSEGWISTPTWKLWAKGIRHQSARWPFSAVLAMLLQERPAHQFHLHKFTADPGYDPHSASPWTRRLLKSLSWQISAKRNDAAA